MELEKTQVNEETAAVENEAAQAAEAEIEPSFAEEMEKTFVKIRRGQFVKGVVVHVTDNEVCVNIGYKADGLIREGRFDAGRRCCSL